MEISSILHPDCVLCAVQGSSKKRILELISQVASQHLVEIDQATILASLSSREKVGCTGIGGGIALPHGRIKGLESTLAVLVTCQPPVQYDAIDNMPVDIFFAILVPEEKANEHLQTLSAIAKKFSDKDVLKELRSATTDQALFQVLS
ncbi:PTS IIA-like nitrogen regulatory protein PtsN [Paraglaciecola sp. L1A13]|uniref:PTS IIA-like nitrogen regulatory protein PtsN n=1 Tax=Paraglaciecola sp. L1A13 TaxID=2686359 RepID=UPI00131BA762|nr:PTS IIA-like nitrogen regulatory protein PtsN [Paraglaciecola sp. L1A13]